MQLSRKQIILISIVSGVVLLLTVAAALILTPREGDAPPESNPAPAETVSPTATPIASPTPPPTAFRLPLVPQWDTPQPGETPAGAVGAFVPQRGSSPDAVLPEGTALPWVGAYDAHTRDILAVALQDGRAAALLLLRLDQEGLTLAALPTDVVDPSGRPLDETRLPGEDLAAQGPQAVTLVEALTGRRYGAWMALDLSCVPAVLEVTGPLGGQGAQALAGDGQQRAQGALSLMTGATAYIQQASLLKLPALKRAVGDAFSSNLSPRELWSLFWTVRNGITTRGILVPSDGRQADLSALQNFFRESS
ncbi:MAG: hypothetical protein IJQ45_07355 [Clostridia bacterium]|nr:hypothetical protein [Clostridia bacterium]